MHCKGSAYQVYELDCGCGRYGRNEKSINSFGRITWKEEKFGRRRRKWRDNIGIELSEIEWKDVEWIRLAHDKNQCWAFVNTVMNIGIPKGG
jgi:hypothetical protein